MRFFHHLLLVSSAISETALQTATQVGNTSLHDYTTKPAHDNQVDSVVKLLDNATHSSPNITAVKVPQPISAVHRLKKDLFNDYDKMLRPVRNISHVSEVSSGLVLEWSYLFCFVIILITYVLT